MKNHKDLNKQELMTRQENQRVHLGGSLCLWDLKQKPHMAQAAKNRQKKFWRQ